MWTHAKKNSIKFMASCSLGTFLEFFDYTLYGYFADTIGHLFFPHTTPGLQMLATWAIFSIAFLIRPLGATAFGYIADKKGRKKVLPFTIALMAIPTVCIGLLPTFDMVGWWAPLLLLLCRLIQGLAISAEYNGASIFILENNWNRVGLLGALTPFSCGMGMLAAALLAYVFTHNTTTEFQAWQWRLPFIIAGSSVGFVAWYLRRTVQETEQFQKLQQTHEVLPNPLKLIFKDHKLAFVTNILCSAYMCSASYLLLVYMSSYLHQQFNVALSSALLFSGIAACIEAHSTLFFGWISDYLGRWQTLLIASALMVVAALWFVLTPDLTITQVLISIIVFVILLGAFDGPLTIYLAELFKVNMRYSAAAIGYNVGGAAIGGLAPFIISLVLQYIHQPQLILGLYLGLLAALACGMIVLHTRRAQVSRHKCRTAVIPEQLIS